jgi:hypothetical protein
MSIYIRASDFNKMPSWFRAANLTWKFTYPVGTRIKLNKDDLINSARKETGLSDLGPDFWDEPLEKLIYSINEEANLHPIGKFISKKRLINLLVTRLKAEWWFRKEPGILEQDLYPVLLIAGLQRTGTTKLQRLLSCDPDTRSVLSWEALNPVPPVKGVDRRIRSAKTSELVLKYMAPGFFAIHPVEHQSQEEDILLLDVSFMSTTPEATMYVPSYAAWLERTNQSLAYVYSAKLLKLLQWQRPAKYWVLKSPHHLEFFDLIDQYYGDVHYLWTHRELASCVPSFLSMVAHGQAIFSDQVDIHQISEHWMKKTKYMLDKAISFRKRTLKKEKFIDIHYNCFIDHSVETVRSIYFKAGMHMNQDIADLMISSEQKNHKDKYGKHLYHLSDFGLSEDKIKIHYQDYIKFLGELNYYFY